jgi:pimeloyl-ACP methyl ester carboxylesterase
MKRVVYLHGFASSPSSNKAKYFAGQLAAAGAYVEVPHLAAGDFEHLTITGQLDIVDGAVGKEPTALIGSSLGGYLAALYAARHATVTRLVLLAPAFHFAERARERYQGDGTVEVFHYAYGENRPIDIGALREDAARYEGFPDFGQPALIFHGAHDDVVPPQYSEEFAAGRKNVTLEIVDSGHELLNVLDYIAPKAVQFLTA